MNSKFNSMDSSKSNIEFLYIGQLETHKGVTTLLNTIDDLKHNKYIFKIAGNGSLVTKVQKNENLNYLGHISGQKKIDVFLNSDVLIIPSEWPEIFGLVIIEAFQNGIPVIGSNIGAIKELIDDGKNGFLFETGNKESLIEKIYCIANNPNLLKTLKSNAFTKGKKFTLDNMTKDYEKLFYKLIKN